MDKRLGRLAGFAAFALVLARLGRLMVTEEPAAAWPVVMMASVFLGGVIWWLLSQTVSKRPLAIGLFALAGTILFLRISVTETLFAGFVPTPDTIETLRVLMGDAIETIRFGLAPIVPDNGVVAILAVVMWVIGGLFMWGSTSGPVLAMVLPGFALYLQLAVMDREPTGLAWMVGSVIVIGLGIVAVALERRVESGRVRNSEGRPIARQTQAAALVLAGIVGLGAIATATSAADLVPARGNFRWRSGTGYGSGGSGISFDRLADLQQRIITRRNEVVFSAVLSPNSPPANQIYWRMETLDTFNGEAWTSSGRTVDFDLAGSVGGDPAHRYQGSTTAIAANVRIEALRMAQLPTPGVAEEIDTSAFNTSALQIGYDGALVYGPELGQDDEYTILRASLPMYGGDVAALATGSDGELTPLFAAAAEAGEFQLGPDTREPTTREVPADLERYLQLPEDTPLGILAEALVRTEGATTDFERAWLLQHWFRDSGDFTYSATVSTGHSTLDLEAWLTDSGSLNFRTGYCEQFAASMGVMGRALGIPSRVVWGFTPGQIVPQPGGEDMIQVRDNNAHAWVEMWMDGFGWVRFDPTPRGGGVLPASMTAAFDPGAYLDQPEAPISGAPEEPGFVERGFEEGLPGTETSGPAAGPFPWIAVTLATLVVAAMALIPTMKSLRRRRRMARIREGDITAAWDEIVDRLSDLGQPVPHNETPLEFAGKTDSSLVSLATRYSAAVYGGRNGTANESDLEVAEDWIKRRYEGSQRARAIFNPRSLLDRDR